MALRRAASVVLTVLLSTAGIPDVFAITANYVLGQDDGTVSAPEPIFTKGTANNGAHKLGLSLGSMTVGGIVMDTTDHRLFVTDTNNHRVLVYDLDAGNILVDRVPDHVIGQLNFYSNSAGQTQSTLSLPLGLAYDDTNNSLFVVGNAANRVTIYDVTSITDGENAIHVLGQPSFTTSTAATTQEGLKAPAGLAYDATNNRLFVTQTTGNRVSVFDTATIYDGKPAANVLGQANFTATTAATTQAGMNVPYDVALSGSTTLFVSEGTGNRVTVYNIGDGITDGENAINVLGQANFTATALGNTQAGMNAPRGLAYDPATQTLYVAQATGNRVTTYNLGDGITNGENAVNVLGQSVFTVITAAVTQAGFSSPTGVYIDRANSTLYVPQSAASRVSIFDVASITNGENAVDLLGQSDDNIAAPSPVYTKGSANNAAYKMGLSGPGGIAVDGTNHRLFVTDSTNNRVLVYNLDSNNILSDRVPDNVLGRADFYTNASVSASQDTLGAPSGLELDIAGNRLFVADSTRRRIMVYDITSITDGENATGVLGQANFTAAASATTQSAFFPRDLAYDSVTGQLFVSDAGHRVLIFDATTIENGESAIGLIGQDDGTVSAPQPVYTKSTANNAAHKLGLSAPIIGIVMDTVDHRLFVSDTTNNRVLVYNLDSNNVLLDRTPDNVLGQVNFYDNSVLNANNGMRTPNGLAYDITGKRLFVVEPAAANRVKIFDVATITDGEDAVNVLGQVSFTASTAATTQAGLNVPTGVAYDDATDRLYVAQNTGNRVTVYDLSAGYTDYPDADNLLGQYDETSMSAPVPLYTKSQAHNVTNRIGYSAPTGIALDTVRHRLYVSDISNRRILSYNMDSNNVLLDRIPDNVIGQNNFYSISSTISQTRMQGTGGMFYDSENERLFIAENGNQRVSIWHTAALSDGMAASYVLGKPTFTSSATADVTQAGLGGVQDVYFHSGSNLLYVAQNTGNRVSVFDLGNGITDGMNASYVLGQASFTDSTAANTQAGMNQPWGLGYDAANNYLFVAQGNGSRVTVYDVTSITTGENAINVLGQANFTGASPASTQAGMNMPLAVVYDNAAKYLYVSQTTGNRVTVYDLNGGITNGQNAVNVLGQATFTAANAATTQAGLNNPQYMVYDAANTMLYVVDRTNRRTMHYNVASITDGENAIDSLGQTEDDSLSDPEPVFTKGATDNTPNRLGLSNPTLGLALDPTDNRLFVSDTANNRVLQYDLDSNGLLVDLVPDHVLGQGFFYTNATGLTQAGLNAPYGLAYDDANNRLFVSDSSNNRTLAYDVASITNGENAIGVIGQADFTTRTPTATQAGMNGPMGIAYDTTYQRLFIANQTNSRVTIYNLSDGLTDGENAIGVIGQADFTASAAATTQAGMNIPWDLALSGSTTLFVSQSAGNRVTVYDVTAITDGEDAINVLGQTLFTGTTAAVTQAGMSYAQGMSYDPVNQRLYVAQATGKRVTSYNLADGITNGENAVNVVGQASFTTSTIATGRNGLSSPTGVLIDPEHNRLFITDSGNHRVLTYNTHVGIGNGEPAVSVLGQSNFTTTTAATTQAGMNIPFDVTLSGSTTLFVSQGTGNRVTLYNIGDGITDGENAVKVLGQLTFTATAAGTTQAGLNAPRGIGYDALTKTLYVSQITANRVTTYNLGDGITDGENAVTVLGQTNFTNATALTSQTGLNAPNGVFVDSANSALYVLQSGAHRVSIFDVTGITNGESAVNVLGQTDNDLNPPGPVYTKGTANNAAYKMGLSSPRGLALDTTNHRLFVSDSGNNRVLVYNLTVGNILIDTVPDTVLGQQNFYENATGLTQAGLSGPDGLALDIPGNKLYVSDANFSRIMIFDTTSLTDGENAIDVIGKSNFTTSGLTTTQVGLSAPSGIDYNQASGQLFVADTGNNRVVIYSIDPPGNTPASAGGDAFHFFGF